MTTPQRPPHETAGQTGNFIDGAPLPGDLSIEPHLPTWTGEHYYVYGNGREVYNSLCEPLGDDESNNLGAAIEAYNTPEVFKGSNWFRDSLTRTMAIMSAERGIEPTKEGNRQTFMQLSPVVFVAEATTMRELSEAMALYARCATEDLPHHFNRIDHQLICKDLENSLTTDVTAMMMSQSQ